MSAAMFFGMLLAVLIFAIYNGWGGGDDGDSGCDCCP